MKTAFEVVAGAWTVRGLLHASGVHAGAVEYSYRKTGSEDAWKSAKIANVPTTGKVAEELEKAKEKAKTTLRARLTGAQAVEVKKPDKAVSKKAAVPAGGKKAAAPAVGKKAAAP
eukprot:CAMPEP_0197878818 /NCGR_PEP_ID=MMETSP1439-20131203/7086_1 /TAXON_ID=66791 /ORGANISM="Gonyaulax spinifera, Strain CCMP409" /LENGTH=114 /DNA_ID=CAMNT_0043498269 /DNA_START=59 /DNA_END=399 /DNA_ORIENTATION=+